MKTTEIKIKNFTGSSYGVFENGKFINSNDGWEKMINRAAQIANEGNNLCTIATIRFAGTDEEPTIEEGIVIMRFYKVKDTVYITNQLTD